MEEDSPSSKIPTDFLWNSTNKPGAPAGNGVPVTLAIIHHHWVVSPIRNCSGKKKPNTQNDKEKYHDFTESASCCHHRV